MPHRIALICSANQYFIVASCGNWMCKMFKYALMLSALLCLQCVLALDDYSRYNFATSIFDKINAEHQNENVILSPVSLQTVMTMAYMGAEGETAAELRTGLFLDGFNTKNEIAADYREFLTDAAPRSRLLSVANRIYVGQNYEVLPDFKELAMQTFDSEAVPVDFSDNQKTAGVINEWVESKTNKKIKNLVNADSLSSDTAAILVNAIYFKARWQTPFDSDDTEPRDFSLNAQDKIKVETMYQEHVGVRYAEFAEYDATAVELQYAGTSLSMMIMLPNKVDGLSELEQKLNFTDLLGKSEVFRFKELDLYLPKFKVEFGLDALEILKKMGITKPFGPHAELSAMVKSTEGLFISDVKHKAFIEVHERGTEAGAASYVVEQSRMARLHPDEFRVNHPFVFAIKDSHAIYFLGHVVKP